MDKNNIKKFAMWARREMIGRVSQKALQYGIEKDKIVSRDADSVNGKLLSPAEKQQRIALIKEIEKKGYEEVIEEVAYTWFNRFCALRFMEVNNYLPSRIRVFTDENNRPEPQMLTEALHLELANQDMNIVIELKEANKTEELFKFLLIKRCNKLNEILPGMFQVLSDYTELLLPDNLLREGNVIEQMISLIPEEDWKDAVQIIGWLYQYYNSEKKDEVDASVKKGNKVKKEEMPAKTQLFTPDWIVKYMVENSLGRLWTEGHPDGNIKDNWKYYLEEAEQEESVKKELQKIRAEYAKLTPKDIKIIDPCCGSGHILVYVFDVLMQIYTEYGYTAKDAVICILRDNIYGLDIDDRAAQLAYFAVMMQARKYDSRFLTRKDGDHKAIVPQPNIYAIKESNNITPDTISLFCGKDKKLNEAINSICKEMYDAKEYGSIISTSEQDWDMLYNRFNDFYDINNMFNQSVLNELLPMVKVAEILSQQYDIVITNPPYIGSQNMGDKLLNYITENYSQGKADLYGAFIIKSLSLSKSYISMITLCTWMFQSRFKELRELLYSKNLVCMNHLGTKAFEEIGGEIVQTTAFCYSKRLYNNDYRSNFVKLTKYDSEKEKEANFSNRNNLFVRSVNICKIIPNKPLAYYISKTALEAFDNSNTLKEELKPKQGTSTGNDKKYVRYWHEIIYKLIGFNISSIDEAHNSKYKYFPLDKGGEFRKWYGNNERIIKFDSLSFNELLQIGNHLPSKQFYFKEGLTWSKIASELSVRYSKHGFVFSSVGLKGFPEPKKELYILGFMNSIVCRYYVKIISPGFSIVTGDIEKIPIIFNNTEIVKMLTQTNVETSKTDWDSFETSWDFEKNPLIVNSKALWDATAIGATMHKYYGKPIKVNSPIELCYLLYKGECEERFKKLQTNEEELNRIFINIYGLQDELTPEVEDKDITVYRIFDDKKAIPVSMDGSRYALTKSDVIKNFISYAVGCMFGRYSLDTEGLAYAGGEWDESKYKTYPAESDNIIPICDDEYFDDDITGKFVKFVETVYGKDSINENLKFIADALGGKGQPKEVIRNYFLNDFYKDHCNTYKKLPIYWQFDSGKDNGFKALIYMHRYQPDTLARVRTEYVHEQQSRYATAIEDIENRIKTASTADRVKLSKALEKLKKQDDELRAYEEKIHHLADRMIEIDLDDGVKHNYEIFKDVLAKIK